MSTPLHPLILLVQEITRPARIILNNPVISRRRHDLKAILFLAVVFHLLEDDCR